MPRSRGNSRSGSVPASPRARSLDVTIDPRGQDVKYSSRSKNAARGSSAPPTPSSPNRSTFAGSTYRSAFAGYSSPKASCDTKTPRLKRRGYDHPGAATSPADMLYMAQSFEGVSERGDARNGKSAGVRSDRMAEISRCAIEDHHHTEIPVYSPPFRSDPIAHRQYPCDKHLRDETKIKGAAGVRTDRLTFLNMNWITQHADPAKRAHDHALDYVYEKTDPISHIAPPPVPLTTGIRRFEGAHDYTKVPIAHSSVAPPKLTPKQIHDRVKSKEVRTTGDIIYNVAGEEDLIPAATHRHTKADLPPTALHKYENDRDTLPPFFRLRQHNRQSPTLGQSEDMYYSMYGHSRAEAAMEKAKDKPPDYDAMVYAMQGGRRPSQTEMDRIAGYVTDRAIERRRSSDMGSPKKSSSLAMPYPVAAQTYREPTSTQRQPSEASQRTRKAQSLDAYTRRSRREGSVGYSNAASAVSVDSQIRGSGVSPKSARTRRANSTDDFFGRSSLA